MRSRVFTWIPRSNIRQVFFKIIISLSLKKLAPCMAEGENGGICHVREWEKRDALPGKGEKMVAVLPPQRSISTSAAHGATSDQFGGVTTVMGSPPGTDWSQHHAHLRQQMEGNSMGVGKDSGTLMRSQGR